ncbi:hypothetical protein PVAND_010081 [Polypedilum vanderplanki]|uniref:Uncharacterized protein n=1 Tax=Polypedilum vanderplanki TaxID=319348 RepID=A0A9J6CFK2_POLVA|nr:hypothetical protein PVAND_010081 [Polypedilum vanderplanki]
MDDQKNQEILIHIPMNEEDQVNNDLIQSIEEEHLEEDETVEEIIQVEPKSSGKKRVSLTIEKKIEIIKRHENGETQKSLAEQFKVGRTTISDILKRKYKFFKFVAMNSDKTENLKRRRTLRRTIHTVLEENLLQWYNELRESGAYISGPMIAQRATQLHKELGYKDNFNASNGWLDRFKVRNGIKLCGIREVKTESDINAVAPFRGEIESIAAWYNLSLEQIYNADETDLFWKMLPNPESDLNEVKASVRAYRERMTVLTCTNATGSHKLPLVCIGRGKRSRTFTSNEIKNLQVHYYSQETAWMDKEIFKTWFHSHFIPSVREHLQSIGLSESALLLIDRSTSHPADQHLRTTDNCFFVHYFPVKVKTLVQPMEQGIIRDMKLQYRYNLLVELINKNLSISEFHKQLSIKDAIRLIFEGWNSVSQENIQRCFSKIFPSPEATLNTSSEPIVSIETFMELIKQIPECINNNYTKERLEYWLSCDDAEPKKDCNSYFNPLSDDGNSTQIMKNEFENSSKVFDTYSEDVPQTIEIIASTIGSHLSEDEEVLNEEEEVGMIVQEEQHEILDQAENEMSEDNDNILYDESECDITCKQALDSLNIVLKFMKSDAESRYRDVVFLSELKKKLKKRLLDTSNPT